MKNKLLYSDDINDYLTNEEQEQEINEFGDSSLSFFIDNRANDLMEDIDYINTFYNYYLVVGNFGRWNGTRKINYIFDNLSEAINALAPKSDYMMKLEETTEGLKVTYYYHDGTAIATIRALTKAGERYYINNHINTYDVKEIAQHIQKIKGYTKRIKTYMEDVRNEI